MPHELDRIKHLAGLQQEAAISLKGKESAIKAWYNKYKKYTGGNGDPLPFGLIKAYTESGIISDGYEENELAKAEKALGKKEMDWEDQDWQKVYSMTPITQGMEKDLLAITGSKTIDEELLAKVYDVIEDMYASYSDLLGKKESAVAEAPAGLTAQQKQGLAALVKKYTKRKTYGGGGLIHGYLDYLAQTGIWTDAADEKEFDVALKKLGHDDLDAWEQDAEGEEFEQFLELAPITAQSQNDVEKVLGKGFENNTQLISAASDYVKSLPETEESVIQPEPVLNAVKETPATSQVDEAIKKATAQLKSFSNFDGLKPYKPKKK